MKYDFTIGSNCWGTPVDQGMFHGEHIWISETPDGRYRSVEQAWQAARQLVMDPWSLDMSIFGAKGVRYDT